MGVSKIAKKQQIIWWGGSGYSFISENVLAVYFLGENFYKHIRLWFSLSKVDAMRNGNKSYLYFSLKAYCTKGMFSVHILILV